MSGGDRAMNRRDPSVWPLRLLLLGAAALALIAALPFALDTYWQQLGYRILQVLSLALAWNLLAGYCGQVSLGTGAFVGLGAYAMAIAANRSGQTLLLLPLCGVVAALFAALLSRAVFRLRGLYFTIGTLALAEALRILMVNLPTFDGARGIVLQVASVPVYTLYWSALGIALCAALLTHWLQASPLSLALRAVRDDEPVASQMGVRSLRVKTLAFVCSAFIIGLVGGLQALKLGTIEPYGAFGMGWTIDTVAAAIIGGMASRGGPYVGALLYVLLGELLRNAPELHGAITGLILLIVIRLAPQGLWPALLGRLRPRATQPEVQDG